MLNKNLIWSDKMTLYVKSITLASVYFVLASMLYAVSTQNTLENNSGRKAKHERDANFPRQFI